MSKDFYSEFEGFIDTITEMRELDLDTIGEIIAPVCKALDIARVEVVFYNTPRDEAQGNGRHTVCYDSLQEAELAIKHRIVTEALSITDSEVYKAIDAEWTEQDRDHAEAFSKVMMLAASRSALLAVAKRRTFFDDDGYHNLNYFMKNMETLGQKNEMTDKVAVHFNLKHFSLINQQIGRKRGTAVMHGFIDSLADKLGDKGLVCRMGGDNFIVLADIDMTDIITEHLSGTAIKYNNYGDRVMVSATAGVLLLDDKFTYDTPSDVMDRVISASQSARSGGQEDIIFFSKEMEERKAKVMRLQQMFPEALKNGEFLIYYQPKVEVSTGRLVGAEALCRWAHDGSIIKPDDFIPTYEQSLDICKLDFYMLDHVCADIRKWLDEGREVVRVSVNLSRKHMMDIDLLDNLMKIIDKHNVPHKYIEIELTETTTDVEFRDLKRVVKGLQQAGVYTSVDDFGIGYSSLNLISEIPWNVIKIDKSLIPVKDDRSSKSVMFKYIISMAKELGLECIAEGVETDEQIELMKIGGCDIVQGFFFDKPLSQDEFISRLEKGGYQPQ
ncbi:MAG: EAL domain-containing protein [Ruminococcus sp.]|nr:EAL domain-containing protein [Ruminococcus sp.]